jgi:hypothetical protein
MALDHSTTTELGCGRDIDEVWANAGSLPDAHERTCPDCQAARASLRELNAATRDLRSRDQSDPELHLSGDLVSKITSIARAEVRRGRRIPLRNLPGTREDADLTVSEQAIAGIIRDTCDRFADIEARRCSVEISDRRDGLDDETVAIRARLRISVAASTASPGRIEELREQVIAAVRDRVGVIAQVVDIDVEDVHDA